jgi:pimeloyl-ACP methyl ester carboxylesterase
MTKVIYAPNDENEVFCDIGEGTYFDYKGSLYLLVDEQRGLVFDYADEIKSGVLLVHGDKAFSYYASEKVMKMVKGDNKEFYTVKGAGHCDLWWWKEFYSF